MFIKTRKSKLGLRKKKPSQNSKVSLLNLVFLNEFCEFRPWKHIAENQLALSFPKLVSKKKSAQGKISLDEKLKKISSSESQNSDQEKKETSQNPKVNLVFLNEFCEFPLWRDIVENQLALSFPKLVSKKKSAQGKISLDEKLKKISSSESQNSDQEKKETSQNPKVNLVFLNEFCEFRHEEIWWESAGAELSKTGLKTKIRPWEN